MHYLCIVERNQQVKQLNTKIMITKVIYRIYVIATNKKGRRYSYFRDFETYDVADKYYNRLFTRYSENFEISLFQVNYYTDHVECLSIISDFNWF